MAFRCDDLAGEFPSSPEQSRGLGYAPPYGHRLVVGKVEMTQLGNRELTLRSFRLTSRRCLFLGLGLVSLSGLAPIESFARDQATSHRLSIRSAFNRIISAFHSRSHRSPVTLPKLVVTAKKPHKAPPPDRAAAADTLTLAVQQFIAAGETDDVSQRTAYLAPRVFFYGHNRSREQASKEIGVLNRTWPQRKFAAPEQVDVYAIPNRPGAYKVVSVYEYDMVGRELDRMTGKARLTCVFEYGEEGPRIVGIDEKLLSETTRFYRDYNSIPVASNQEVALGEAKVTAAR
jgi:hypothetical protein